MKSKLIEIALAICTVLSLIFAISQFFMSNFLLGIGLAILATILIAWALFIWFKKFCSRSFTKQCKNVGIVNIIQQKDKFNKNYKKIPEKIKKASEICAFFTTGHGFFKANEEALKYAANNNILDNVRVIIGKKDSAFLTKVAEVEIKAGWKSDINSIHNEITSVIDILEDIKKALKRNVSIEIRYVETEFRASMVLIKSRSMEGKKKEKWGWVTLTLPPAKARNSISFEIEGSEGKDKDDIYSQCEDHFNSIWKQALSE